MFWGVLFVQLEWPSNSQSMSSASTSLSALASLPPETVVPSHALPAAPHHLNGSGRVISSGGTPSNTQTNNYDAFFQRERKTNSNIQICSYSSFVAVHYGIQWCIYGILMIIWVFKIPEFNWEIHLLTTFTRSAHLKTIYFKIVLTDSNSKKFQSNFNISNRALFPSRK